MSSLWLAALLALRSAVGHVDVCQGGRQCGHDPPDDADPSLIQARVDWWAHSRSIDQHYIEFDGDTKTPVPRRVTKDFVRELMITYPLKNNPIKVNGKKAYIPFSSILEGEFSRRSTTQDQEDYGVEKAMAFLGSEGSMISDKVKLAFAEKSHTYYFPGELPEATKDMLEAERAAQTPEMQATAKENRQGKLSAMAGLAATIGPQVIVAGKDLNHVASIRKFVDSDQGGLTPHQLEDVRRLQSEMAIRRKKTTATMPIRSSIGCLHFENEELMHFTADGVELPLDRKFVAYRGRLAGHPNQEYQMSGGFAVFHYNETSDSLDIFFLFSSVIDIIDSSSGFSSQFSVGPPDGHHWWVPHEGRESSVLPIHIGTTFRSLGQWAQGSALSVPSDFTLLHSKREELGCKDTDLAQVVERTQGLRDILGLATKLHHINALDMFTAVPKVSEAYSSAVVWIMCAVEYMRPVYNDTAVVMTPLMLMGFLHVIMELPPKSVAQLVESDTIWNTVGGKLLGS